MVILDTVYSENRNTSIPHDEARRLHPANLHLSLDVTPGLPYIMSRELMTILEENSRDLRKVWWFVLPVPALTSCRCLILSVQPLVDQKGAFCTRVPPPLLLLLDSTFLLQLG